MPVSQSDRSHGELLTYPLRTITTPCVGDGDFKMACYHPVTMYRSNQGRNKETGSWPLVSNPANGFHDMPVIIPCGNCVGCRIDRSRDWATRCVLEASEYQDNCFITLTYKNTPTTLIKEDFVLFMKRLRKKYGAGIRFFHCGEYGTLGNRPHHHACLFNHKFPDQKLWTMREGVPLYNSDSLNELWGKGYTTIGEVTYKSAAYVARYVLKKVNGEAAAEHYNGRQPEYITMSRRPGIGLPWLKKYHKDMIQIDAIKMMEGTFRPPRYFDAQIKKINPQLHERIKHQRQLKIQKLGITPERLAVKERLKKRQIKQLKRGFENG